MHSRGSPTSSLKQLDCRKVRKWRNDTAVSSIFRNMAMLATGNAAAKAIGILTVPVITRLYLPEHMGVLSIFTAFTAMLVPFCTLRYSIAIPLPETEELAINLALLCALCLLLTSAVAFFVFWVSAPALLAFLSMEQFIPFWWLLPVGIAGSGLYELLTNWAVREKDFKPLAKTEFCQALVGGLIKVCFGFLGFKPLGLLIGQVFTQAGGVIFLFCAFWAKFKTNFRHISRNNMVFMFRRYADFPKYRLSSQVLLILSTKAPLLFFAWQYGAETTGQLGLGLMMLALPITLFGQTTGQAFYAEIAKIGRKNPVKIYKVAKDVTKKLFLFSIPPFLILFFLGPWLFQTVFGKSWREAGEFASTLAVYLSMQFVSSPLVNALSVFEKQRLFLLINIIRVIGLIMIFGLSFFIGLSSNGTIRFYSIALSIYYIFITYLVFSVIRNART